MDASARTSASSPVPAARLSPAGDGALRSWYLYDAAISVIDALMITFVFATYLTSSSFGSPEHTSQVLSCGTVIAAVLIFLAAPLVGWLSDRSGRRSTGIAVFTAICATCTAACFLVRPEEQLLVLGVALLSAANAAKELAVVDYYAALPALKAIRNRCFIPFLRGRMEAWPLIFRSPSLRGSGAPLSSAWLSEARRAAR